MNAPSTTSGMVELAERLGREVARPLAIEIDRDARFPHETIDALRGAGALAALLPPERGGAGASMDEVAQMCFALGRHCASTAMVFAMHQIQVACLLRHRGSSVELARALERLVEEGSLIASVTSEVGPGGNLRHSEAVCEVADDRFRFEKRATTVSYGAHADLLLVTLRRDAGAVPSDQVLVLAERRGALSGEGSWDTLGMRGTCSPAYVVEATGPAGCILPEPFGDIATHTMVPVAHLLWSSLWSGIAADAFEKARSMHVRKARGGHAPGTGRIAQMGAKLQRLRTDVEAAAREYAPLYASDRRSTTATPRYAYRINNLKLSASQLAVEIVLEAIQEVGIAAYRNDTEFSLGRHLRDALSAQLMVHNDRIEATNATLLKLLRDTP